MDISVDIFAKKLSTDVKEFYKFFKSQGLKTNPALSGAFAEELVLQFIKGHIGSKVATSGTIYKDKRNKLDRFLEIEETDTREYHSQLDCMIYDPRKCVPAFSCGNFAIINAKQCECVIEIKSTVTAFDKFTNDLNKIRKILPLSKKLIGLQIRSKKSNEEINNLKNSEERNNFHIFTLFRETNEILEARHNDISSFISTILKLNKL